MTASASSLFVRFFERILVAPDPHLGFTVGGHVHGEPGDKLLPHAISKGKFVGAPAGEPAFLVRESLRPATTIFHPRRTEESLARSLAATSSGQRASSAFPSQASRSILKRRA